MFDIVNGIRCGPSSESRQTETPGPPARSGA
jgi:hypothetical protein